MRVVGIIHQQICQLRWHLLACLGLLMVLPIEEAVVNLRAGAGFYSVSMVAAAITFSPLLAGLLACAIVQGDLDEKRYIFWRSKPANVKLLMTLKFFVGFVASLLLLACPLVFAVVTIVLLAKEHVEREHMYPVPFLVLIAIMTYSLCFACNVLVRKTARAWLIGILLAGFLLVLPFILPLGYRDFVTDVAMWAPISFVLTVFVASVAAFVFALYATRHDWHLRTDLKALLWVAGGLLFVFLMLLKSQVANIKVLDEKQIESYPGWASGWRLLYSLQNRIIFGERSYVDVSKDRISLRKIADSPIHGILGTDSASPRNTFSPRLVGYRTQIYPWYGYLYKSVDGQTYSFNIVRYYQVEKKEHYEKRIYEKIYLRSYKVIEKEGMPLSELDELDISDCLMNKTNIYLMAMRLIDDVIVACVNQSCIVVDVTDPGQLKRIDTKLDVLKWSGRDYRDSQEKLAIPLVPVEGIGIGDKIRLSIDLYHQFYYSGKDIYGSSIVDIHDDKIAFFRVSNMDVRRYEVVRWDRENIYYKFSTSRPFTILESIGQLHFGNAFVKDGNLYCYGGDTLLVFDVRSKRGIRKLGHFVRMDYGIVDIAVLDDGNILLSLWWQNEFSRSYPSDNRIKSYLCLLENPS